MMDRFANRSAEMAVFARTVELGGFSAAARALGMTPSAVSKLVGRLEGRLGARLMNRSTRRLALTAEGEAFYARATRILADIDEAEREASAGARPRGKVRINSNLPIGVRYLLPLVPEFLRLHPEVMLDVTLSDHVIDLMEERADVAIRTGPLRPSSLIARKLGESRVAVVASPDYLARRGEPRTVAELHAHNRIGFNFARSFDGWPFRVDGEDVAVPIVGDFLAGDGESARRMAIAGVGIARLGLFHVADDIAAGRLVLVLEAFNPGDIEEIHAVFLGKSSRLPARIRAVIEFLAERIRI